LTTDQRVRPIYLHKWSNYLPHVQVSPLPQGHCGVKVNHVCVRTNNFIMQIKEIFLTLPNLFLWDGGDSNSMRFGFTDRPICSGYHP
jgi:hypothetical protein